MRPWQNHSYIYKFTVHPGSGIRYLAILAITVFISFVVLSYAVGERALVIYRLMHLRRHQCHVYSPASNDFRILHPADFLYSGKRDSEV